MIYKELMQEVHKHPKNTLLATNSKMPVKEIETTTAGWKGRPSKIAASFTKVSELEKHHIKHFASAPYLWKPMQGSVWGGMLLDDKSPYVHLVLVNETVLDYILKLVKEYNKKV